MQPPPPSRTSPLPEGQVPPTPESCRTPGQRRDGAVGTHTPQQRHSSCVARRSLPASPRTQPGRGFPSSDSPQTHPMGTPFPTLPPRSPPSTRQRERTPTHLPAQGTPCDLPPNITVINMAVVGTDPSDPNFPPGEGAGVEPDCRVGPGEMHGWGGDGGWAQAELLAQPRGSLQLIQGPRPSPSPARWIRED